MIKIIDNKKKLLKSDDSRAAKGSTPAKEKKLTKSSTPTKEKKLTKSKKSIMH